jgi:sugar phosphate isomerase/epimerase
MSTLWTPDGERPIRRDRPAAGGGQPSGPGQPTGPTGPGGPAGPPDGEGGGAEDPQTEAEMAAQLEELRDQLANTPAALVVANHAFGLFELAAIHLSLDPPQLDQAQVAIDALAALVEGMAGRLGDHEVRLREGLAQLRIAYVQIKSANRPS